MSDCSTHAFDVPLKPCPFCGGEARVNTLKWVGGYTATALCKNEPNVHYLDTWDEDEEKAIGRIIEVWNRRAERTCKNISNPPSGFLCSECRWGDFAEPSHLLTTAKFTDNDGGPNYCPNCGARVRSE